MSGLISSKLVCSYKLFSQSQFPVSHKFYQRSLRSCGQLAEFSFPLLLNAFFLQNSCLCSEGSLKTQERRNCSSPSFPAACRVRGRDSFQERLIFNPATLDCNRISRTSGQRHLWRLRSTIVQGGIFAGLKPSALESLQWARADCDVQRLITTLANLDETVENTPPNKKPQHYKVLNSVLEL